MSYKDFGLDEEKKSTDGPGSKGAKYCLWCMNDVKTGFSLCFQHFVICENCALTATQVSNNERWEEYHRCDKCRSKDVIGYRSHQSIMEWFICKSCIDWAKNMFLKIKGKPKPPTIKNIIIMSASPEIKKIISDHLESVAANDPLFAETLKKPNKNISDCVTYIMNQAKKKGSAVMMADSEVFGMAIHYYDEDNLEVGKPVSGKVSTNKAADTPKKDAGGSVTTLKQKAAKPGKKEDTVKPLSLF